MSVRVPAAPEFGQPTPFRLIPIFDPIKLTLDVIAAIPEGIHQALNGGRPPLTLPETETTSPTLRSAASSAASSSVSVGERVSLRTNRAGRPAQR